METKEFSVIFGLDENKTGATTDITVGIIFQFE